MALVYFREEYPNLNAQEFLFTYAVHPMERNVWSFRSRPKFQLAQLEARHSNAKQWQNKFFFVSAEGLEFFPREATTQEFFI